jgi:hypothetical protein
LAEQLEELLSFGDFEVDPANPDSDVYQEYKSRLSKAKGDSKSRENEELKFDVMNESEAANLDKLKEYDEMIEAYHEYVDHVIENFNFSPDIYSLCMTSLNSMKDHSFTLKSSVLEFWSAEKKQIAEAAREQEKEANEATKMAQAAQKKANLEKELALTAQEKLERRQAALEAANQRLQDRIDEKTEQQKQAAFEAKEMKKKAELAQAAAEKSKAEALEQTQISEAIRISANEARILAERAEEALQKKELELEKKQAESNLFYDQLTSAFDPTAIKSLWDKSTALAVVAPSPRRDSSKLGRSNSR